MGPSSGAGAYTIRPVPALPQDHGGVRNVPVDVIVIHSTEGGDNLDAVAHWWDREDVVASAHYVLNGKEIIQRVDEEMVAFHCANRAMHYRSIGIEVTGHAARPETWSPAKLEQLLWLCAGIVGRHPTIQLVHGTPGLIGHAEVPCPKPGCPYRWGGASHHTDPGPHFPWNSFLAALRDRVAPPLAPAPVPAPALVKP